MGGKHWIEIPRKPEPINWLLISGRSKPSSVLSKVKSQICFEFVEMVEQERVDL